MQRHVILLTDAHEAPAYELIEALSQAGVQTLIEGLREPSGRAAAKAEPVVHVDDSWEKLPLAVLYEVVPGADVVELHNALEQAATCWPDTSVIACRRQLSGFHGQSWRSLDGTALKRLGFRAIADKAAQLPAILREIEGHGATGELRLQASGVTELMNESFTQTCSPGATRPQAAPRPAAAQAAELSGWFTFASVIARGAPPPAPSSTNQQLAGSPARSTAAALVFASSTQPLDPDMHSFTTIAGPSRLPRKVAGAPSSPGAQADPARARTTARPVRRRRFTPARTSR